MNPLLFEATDTGWIGYGLGALSEATSCKVTKGGEMVYELEMGYPVNGKHYADLIERRIIYCKPDQVDGNQAFRIYRITKPIKGVVTVYARHISYDLQGVVAWPFTATSAKNFATKIKAAEGPSSLFSFSSDINYNFEFKNERPESLRSLLGGSEQSWSGVYGGDLVFDTYEVKLLEHGGTDRGVTIRYGVDLIDAQMEQNIADVYTGIVPYYAGGDTDAPVVGDVLWAVNPPAYKKVKPVDVSKYIATTPDKATVNSIGRQWLNDNNIRKPEVNLTLKYAQLADKVVQIYDPITVKIEKLDVEVTANVSKTVWDVLKERYESVEVGDVRPTLGGAIYDASRLRKGLLPAERIQERSIGGGKLRSGAVGETEIGKKAVTVNKIGDGAVTAEKIGDGQVTGVKILDHAVAYAKLNNDVQVTFAEMFVAYSVFSNYIYSDGVIQCNSIVVGSTQFRGRWIGSTTTSGARESVYVLGAITE